MASTATPVPMSGIPYGPSAMLARLPAMESRIARLDAHTSRTVDHLRALRADFGRREGKLGRLEGKLDRAFVILPTLTIGSAVGLAGLVARVGRFF